TQPSPRFTGSVTTLPARTGAGIPIVTRLHRQSCTASSVPATISSAVSDEPELNRRRSFPFEVSAFTCEPPTSTARTMGPATAPGSGRLRLALPAPACPLEQEGVESRATVARLRRCDRHFDLELVVVELLDALAAVHQRSSGACVAFARHLALLSWDRSVQLLHAAL